MTTHDYDLNPGTFIWDSGRGHFHITLWDLFGVPDDLSDAWHDRPIDVRNPATDVTVRFTKFAQWAGHNTSFGAAWPQGLLVLTVWKDHATLRQHYAAGAGYKHAWV